MLTALYATYLRFSGQSSRTSKTMRLAAPATYPLWLPYVSYSLGLLFALCAALPTIFTMPDLTTDAIGRVFYDQEEPTIRGVIHTIGDDTPSNQAYMIPLTLLAAVFAFMAMTPFNAYYAYLDGQELPRRLTRWLKNPIDRSRRWPITITNFFDTLLSIGISITAGAAIGSMWLKALTEIFEKEPSPGLQQFLILYSIWFNGRPVANALTKGASEEIPRSVHIARALVLKAQGRPQSTPEEARGLASTSITPLERQAMAVQYLDQLDAIQLTPARNLIGDQLPPHPLGKATFVELTNLAVLYVTFFGSEFFGTLAQDGIKTFSPWSNTFANPSVQATVGTFAHLSFMLLWTFLMKNAVQRPLMRMFSSQAPHLKPNVNSGGQAINYLSAYVFGVSLAATTLPFIDRNDARQIVCAVLSNIVFAATGFNEGRQTLAKHLPRLFRLPEDPEFQKAQKIQQQSSELSHKTSEELIPGFTPIA